MKKLLIFIFISFALNLNAASLEGVNFPDKVTVLGKELVLNGMGIRKATFLKIKVYIGALYLDQKSKEPNSFLATNAPKQIIMHFVRDADAKKLTEAFSERMKATNKNYDVLKSSIDKLNSHIVDMAKNDQIIVTFLSDGVVIDVKGKVAERIPGAEFSKSLLNIWFTDAPDQGLRSGLLGL